MTTCAVCHQWLPTEASEYGDRSHPCCLSDWLVYLDWQDHVNVKADEVFGRFVKNDHELEVPAQVLTMASYLTFAAPDDVEADVLEEYGLLPVHVALVGHGPQARLAQPVGRLL